MKTSIFVLLIQVSLVYSALPIFPSDNIAIKWGTTLQNFLIQNNLIPPGSAMTGARAIFIVDECMYDTWTVYNSIALPILPNSVPRMPGAPAADIDKAISYAAYRCIADLFDRFPAILSANDAYFQSLGYDKNYVALDNSAAGVGNSIAASILAYRHADGMNQKGDEPLTPNGDGAYADYTNYRAVNPAQPSDRFTDCSAIVDINHWQPLRFAGVAQRFATPYMCLVKPFAIAGPFDVIIPGPPLNNTRRGQEFFDVFTDVITLTSTLNDYQKSIVEFWALTDGATAWQRLALTSARNANLALSDTLKLLIAQSTASFEAGIAAWCYKRFYDSVRPATAIPCLYRGQNINTWKGPYQGTGSVDASRFRPYVNTPPFAEYPSGHSSFSGASSVIHQKFFGNDVFIASPTLIPEGTSRTEPKITAGQPGYQAGVTDVPNSGPSTVGYSPATDITLTWNTWTDAAESAGISRLYGGLHVMPANVDGLTLGRKIANKVWDKISGYFNGRNGSCVCPSTTSTTSSTPLPAGAFCSSQTFAETQAYYCNSDQTGYYQCLSGPFASQSASFQCPFGTSCSCGPNTRCTNGFSPCSTYA